MDESGKELNIHHIVRGMLRSWWLMVGLGLAGALAGFLFSLVRPPIYEARAVLGVNILYGVTEPLALVVEDRALNRVASLILADTTLENTLQNLSKEVRDSRGYEKPSDLRKVLRVERRLAEWHLVAIDRDPQVAAQTAQEWAEVVLATFDDAVEHSLQAANLLAGGSFVVDCEEEMEAGEPLNIWHCEAIPRNVDVENLSEQLQDEIALSHGVLLNISYELLQEASLPQAPILWRRAWLLLAGTFAGMMIGGLLSLFRKDS